MTSLSATSDKGLAGDAGLYEGLVRFIQLERRLVSWTEERLHLAVEAAVKWPCCLLLSSALPCLAAIAIIATLAFISSTPYAKHVGPTSQDDDGIGKAFHTPIRAPRQGRCA